MGARPAVDDAVASQPSADDAALLVRSRTDPDAFVELFDRHFDAVHRYLHRRVGRDLADELAAETFVRAFARRAAFEPRGESALPWLNGVATNVLRRHRRTEERRLRAYARSAHDDAVGLDEDAVAAGLTRSGRAPRSQARSHR